MRVQFLKDHLQYEDGLPMYQEGEIAYIIDETAMKWIADGIVEPI